MENQKVMKVIMNNEFTMQQLIRLGCLEEMQNINVENIYQNFKGFIIFSSEADLISEETKNSRLNYLNFQYEEYKRRNG